MFGQCTYVFAAWSVALLRQVVIATIPAEAGHGCQDTCRRLQAKPATPWEVYSGTGCELVEDGCIQTSGYPTLPANDSCQILARFSAYVLEAIGFDTEAGDALTVNGHAYSGTAVKQSLVFGSMHWSSSSSSTSVGWKICPRSPCSTLVCPDGYTAKAATQHIGCAGLTCNSTVDVDTCCLPKCRAPPGFHAMEHALGRDCPGADRPYYSYYSEATCPLDCLPSLGAVRSNISMSTHCPTPGEYVMTPTFCNTVVPEDYAQWSIAGACETYGPNCVQTAGYPGPYTGGCTLQPYDLYGDFDFEITTIFLDLEDSFDFLHVDGLLSATGSSVPDPFILPHGSQLSFEVDADLSRSGFRICAMPTCSRATCPSGYIFLCESVNASCGSNCWGSEAAAACCRPATAAELSILPANHSSDAASEGCINLTTTTAPLTTTTTTTLSLTQIVGFAKIQVGEFNSSHVIDAWRLTLGNITGIPLQDIYIAASNEPANSSRLSSWVLGYQVHNVIRVSFPSGPIGEDAIVVPGGPPIDYPIPTSISEMNLMLQGYLASVSGGVASEATVVDHGAMRRSGPDVFTPGPNPLCNNLPSWVDDRRFTCDVYETMCTPMGTSTFESVSYGTGYYWYFYNSVTRNDPTEPDARQACCACGGGSCSPGTMKLTGTLPEFCAPCPGGQFSFPPAPTLVTTCIPCDPGTFSVFPAGSPLCLDTSPGYANCCFGATWPTPCQPGTFTGSFAQTACEDCPAGTAIDQSFATECSACEGGRYTGVVGHTSCEDCPSGTYANGTGWTFCEDCPAGTAADSGEVLCTECDVGRFNNELGSDFCDECPLGRHASETGYTECDQCDPGFYANRVGMEDCDICPAGTQAEGIGATACVQCVQGQSKRAGDLFCSACSAGHYSPRLGEVDCLPCQAGRYINESGATSCLECPAGRASDATGLSECPGCVPGRFMNSAGETICLGCNPGHYASMALMTSCDECAAGTVAVAEGLTACLPCSPGRHIPVQSATRCEDCAASRFADREGMSECEVCPLGRFALVPGLTACLDCGPGRYAETNGSSECTQCEYGRYTGSFRSTSCSACSASLPGPPEHWTTMYAINTTGEMTWRELLAATSASDCGCRPGTQPDGADEINYVDGGSPSDPIAGRGSGCAPCGEGLNCLGMGQLRILDGYAWDGGLSVYDCVHSVLEACRGGVPGACAPGRDETKLACAECRLGWVPSTDGSCAECGGADYGVPITCLVVGLALAFLMYMVYDKAGERKRPSLTTLLILISMGQLLTIVQQLGILSSIRVEWGSPLSEILDFVSAIGFMDVDLLRPGCVATMNPVKSYGLRVASVYVALSLVVAAHVVSTCVQHRGRRSAKHWYILFCALGTIVMAFSVSIITTMLAPLQCKRHPNDKRTISWFPSVLCWEDDQHTTMLAIGILACTLPLVFLAASSRAAYVFPTELKNGSPRFLTGWAFLFFRYHTEAYWYGPVLLIRNALISVAPVLHTAVLQTLFLQMVMLVSLVIVANAMPWRAKLANYLEVIMHFVFLSLTTCACFFADEEPANELAIFGTILLLAMPTGILVLVCIGIVKTLQSRGKPFQFFLCHHKVGAGSFSRLLKMQLLKTRGVTRKVFVDTDDLQNLGKLFDVVDQRTECLVAVHSSHLLTRPWCVGELASANRAKVHMQVVRLVSVEKPTDHFIENFASFVPDTVCLTEHGIGLEQVQQALRQFQSLTAIHLPQELQEKTVVSLASTLVGRTIASMSLDIAAEAGEAVPEECLLIVCDKTDLEAASSAFILKELILPIIAPKYQVAAHVLTHGRPLARKISRVALLCTSGLFENPIITSLLDLHANSPSVSILPLMCSSSFVFPTPQVLQESAIIKGLPVDKQQTFVLLTQSIFTEIAVEFSPAALGATEMVLTSRANNVADRLWSNMQSIHARMTQSMSTSASRTRENGRRTSSDGTEELNASSLVPVDSSTAVVTDGESKETLGIKRGLSDWSI